MNIDYTRNDRFSDQAFKLLTEFYCNEDEHIQDAFARAARCYSSGDDQLAQRIYDYSSKGWFMYSSPILSNSSSDRFPSTGLPISCFLSYVPDTLEGLIEHHSETAWLSVKGGGVGGHWGDVRSVSDKAPSPIPFLKVTDSQMTAYKQGETRKGSYAAYLDVSHPEITEFVNIKTATGGDSNRKCFNMFSGVNLPDHFMQAACDDEQWDLVDPHEGSIRDTVSARTLLEDILETRFNTGGPYLNFIDEANRCLPESQKKLGLKIHGSNLCNEIHLATDIERTAVCCLSSVNLEKYDEWKDTSMVSDLVRFLDNVLQYFIDNAPDELAKARYSAYRERSIGIGAMGFHGYLQAKGIPWESVMAKSHNKMMFNKIKKQAMQSTVDLAYQRGCPPDLEGLGRRNAHLLAIAPNANSSIICGCSASIEPIKSNAFVHRTRVGTHLVKNQYCSDILETYGRNDADTWKIVINDKGSVQSFEWMSQEHKDLLKTAFEINQLWVVEHAVDRQPYICQGQSVNVFHPAGTPRADVLATTLKAWKGKLKGLYYLRTEASTQAESVGVLVERDALKDAEECLACEG